MRYVTKMGADNRAFAAALVDMGVRGHIRWSRRKAAGSRATRRGSSGSPARAAPRGRGGGASRARMTGESIVMEQKNHEKFSAAKNSLEREVLKNAIRRQAVQPNWAGRRRRAAVHRALWLTAAAVVAATNGARSGRSGDARRNRGRRACCARDPRLVRRRQMPADLIALGRAGIFASASRSSSEALNSGWWLPLAIPLLGLPLVISASGGSSAPTKEGRAVLDRIAGFKQYLSITERERLDRMTRPRTRPSCSSAICPMRSRSASRTAGPTASPACSPPRPPGPAGLRLVFGQQQPVETTRRLRRQRRLVAGEHDQLGSTAPGSSSGSGGGGSSGGGGGGGGGGGW
jgi:hypothetical protein